jgi:hypothetical protein
MKNRFSPVLIASALALSGHLSAGVILSNNLTETTLSADTIGTSHFEAISFATDNNTYSFNSAILLVAPGVVSTSALNLATAAAADIPEVDLYADDGSPGPGTLIQTLTNPGSFGVGLAQATFTGSGIILSPNTTYWVVLKTISGNFSWGIPTDSIGSGVGFTDTWAFTTDGTPPWAVASGQPDQAEIIGDLVAAPEPSSFWLIACGSVLLLAFGRRLRRA